MAYKDRNKITVTNNINQLLFDKGLFNSFTNKDEVFANYLTFSEAYPSEKYRKKPASVDEYYLSNLEILYQGNLFEGIEKRFL